MTTVWDELAAAASAGSVEPPESRNGKPYLVASPKNPMPNARLFVGENYRSAAGESLLLTSRETFYAWSGEAWREVDRSDLRAQLYARFEGTAYLKPVKDGFDEVPFEPNRYAIANLVEALAAVTHHKPLDAPTWVDGNGLVSASELVPCRNGLLHVPTRRLLAHTPAFFNVACTPVDYDHAAPPPQRWLKFLAELWPDDPDCIDVLQEILGYLLSGDTSQQKLFLCVGPRRSGKGTIARVATQLVGPHNVAGCTLSSLATNFGLAPLVNAPVAIVSDARLRSRGRA